MGLSASIMFNVRGGGNNNNGAAFNPGNANFPTDLTTDTNTGNTNSPVCSSASYNFVAGDVGAWLFIKAGTNWRPGWYKITSVASNKATVDAAVGKAMVYFGTQRLMLNTSNGVASTGTPTSGTWGIDYSHQDSVKHAFTDLVIGNPTTTELTSAGNPVGKNFVGNHIKITGGTGFTTGIYEVVSTSGTTATMDRSVGTAGSTGGAGNLGGAFANLAPFDNTAANQSTTQWIFVQGGFTYSHTTRPIFVLANMKVEGYKTVAGDGCDGGTKPIIRNSASTAMFGLVKTSPYAHQWNYLDLDGNDVSTTLFVDDGGPAGFNPTYRGCDIHDFTSDAASTIGSGSASNWYNCRVYNNGGAGIANGQHTANIYDCEVFGNGNHGIGADSSGGTVYCYRCKIYDNTNDGICSYASFAEGCTIAFNGGDGVGVWSAASFIQSWVGARNNIIYGNGGYGIVQVQSSTGIAASPMVEFFRNNAVGGNTSGNYQNLPNPQIGHIALTEDPFIDGVNGDLRLNDAAGGGALCKGTSSVPFQDVGAVQHEDSAPPAETPRGTAAVMTRRRYIPIRRGR